MKIVPVMDLLDGFAVHARAGMRRNYQPVQSVLAASSRPVDLGEGLMRKLRLREIYLADLNAIAGADPQWVIYDQLSRLGLRFWLDAGVGNADRLNQVLDRLGEHHDLIVGLETLENAATLCDALDRIGPHRVIASLDLDDGRPRTVIRSWSHDSAGQIAERLIAHGVRRLILLDIRRVGTGRGTGTIELLDHLRRTFPHVHLTCGGGVHSVADVRRLAHFGCDAVLLATAIHNGTVGLSEIEELDAGSQTNHVPPNRG